MSYYPEPDSHITNKVKVVLDLSNYDTKKGIDIGIGTDIDKSYNSHGNQEKNMTAILLLLLPL